MKISLNWLKKYVKIGVSDAELVRLIGARLVEVEGVIDETHKYDKIFVAKVVKAEKIPETHLTLCQINVGEAWKECKGVEVDTEGLVQVVCGAPNVRVGMLAVWIAPGAVVPASVHEDAPFVIGKRKMLGKYESNGMLAGADELDFGDDHSGIVELDPAEAEPGQKLAEVFELDDLVLDIENKSLTHRPDCFGVIGFAREVAGILGTQFVEPEVTAPTDGARKSEAPISVEMDSDVCERYTAVVLDKHGELAKKYLTWTDTILAKSGMRPVDPIVDATNYLMLLTGQPLHAFDYDKFVAAGGGGSAEIVVRRARAGERLVLLDEKEIELNENDVVVCSGNVPVALAGAMGGAATAIDEHTSKIILESATFSLYNLRKTQMAHGIFSEAITRFTKGQPDYQTLLVAMECAVMLASGFRVVGVVDERTRRDKDVTVTVGVGEINGLLGTQYDEKLIVQTLTNVGFVVKSKRGTLEVTKPAWRTDIRIREDVIEEVGRLLGYDNIQPVLPRHATAERNKMLELKSQVRETLKEFGANEVLTYSFVSERLLKKAGVTAENSYRIVNSISPELQLVRQSIVPSLLEKAYVNQKIPFNEFALFEMNKVYQKDWGMDGEGVPVEAMRLGFVLAERKSTETAYYKAKFFVESLLGALGVRVKLRRLETDVPETKPFETKRAAEIWLEDGTKMLGVVGEFKNSVRRNFKLAEYLAGFELDMGALLEGLPERPEVRAIFSKGTRDITVETRGTYEEVVEKMRTLIGQVATISPLAIYQPEGAEAKKISVHLEFSQPVDESMMAKLESMKW